jgi:tetratricopeptide (TPR) repeat protein
MMWDRYPLSHAARIAERTLAAELMLARSDASGAVAALREAVEVEARIPYDEPPGWHAPTRLALGAALLTAGQAAEAETAFREELLRNPGNGWSLQGLVQSLEAQGRGADAQKAREEFGQAWKNADVALAAAHL